MANSEPDTSPETPHAKSSMLPPANHTWWKRCRGLLIDGSIVAGLAVSAYCGWMSVEAVTPMIAAILLSHAKPESTAGETAATALLSLLPRLLRRRTP